LSSALRVPPARRYLELVSIFSEARRAELYSEDALAALPDSDPFGFLARAFQRSGQRDAAAAAMNADLLTYLPCDTGTKVDIASMAHGLECRQPFLDHRLVELAVQLPSSRILSLLRGERLLREACGELLPPWVWRRKRQDCGVPLDHWFRAELKDFSRETLLSARAQARNLFNPAAVERLIDEQQTKRFPHQARLWSLLILELWLREWIDA
jgi:asparagine synthase (glutamine-hydrolysing)